MEILHAVLTFIGIGLVFTLLVFLAPKRSLKGCGCGCSCSTKCENQDDQT